jgi:hypothetical protein
MASTELKQWYEGPRVGGFDYATDPVVAVPEPPRRLRLGFPPLPGFAPGSPGAAGSAGGMAQAHPRVQRRRRPDPDGQLRRPDQLLDR